MWGSNHASSTHSRVQLVEVFHVLLRSIVKYSSANFTLLNTSCQVEYSKSVDVVQ